MNAKEKRMKKAFLAIKRRMDETFFNHINKDIDIIAKVWEVLRKKSILNTMHIKRNIF